MGDNPALPRSVGRHIEMVCRSCVNCGMTIRGIDIERQFGLVQCDTCGKVASLDIRFLTGPDEIVGREAPSTGGDKS